MKNLNLTEQKGIASLLVVAAMALLAVGIPVTTNLVQKNQENRSKAAGEVFTLSGPNLFFGPIKNKYSIGQTLEVIVGVDSFSRKISGVDVVGNYDFSKLDLVSVKEADNMVFDGSGNCVGASSTMGKFSAACYVEDSLNSSVVKGNLIVLTFKTKAIGSAKLTFDCNDSSTIESNIVSDTSDVIVCKSNESITINVVAGTRDVLTPTAMPIKVTPTLAYPSDPTDCRNAYSSFGCACTDGGITYNHGDKLCSHSTNTCVICSEGKIIPSNECTQKCTGIAPTEPVCGPINGQKFDYSPQKEILCKVGEASEVVRNKTTGVYTWTCVLNGKKVNCLTKGPSDSNSYLTLDPIKGSYSVGETFLVTVGANSVSNNVSGVDVVGTYNATNLELVSIKKASSMVFGTSGDCVFGKSLTEGKFAFTCFANETNFDKAIKGDLAVLNFKVKKSGEAKVGFVCVNGSNSDSNMVKSSTPSDIIACNSNTNATFILKNKDSITPPPCIKKAGVSTFSVDTDCGNGNFRYMTFACYDGYKNREGGSTSCKSKNQWKIYADQYCQGRTNKCEDMLVVTEPPKKKIDGKCGTTRNSCSAGSLNDGVLSDSSTEYRWKCIGKDGGKTVNCRMEKQKKINGRCGVKRNTCEAGSVNDGALPDTLTQYKWKCISKNGGESVNCSSVKSNYSVK